MSFVRSVLVLVSGTALGHAITALSMPLLTRLYSPSDFSLLAAFSALLAVLSVSAGLRFDVAVSIPESRAEALDLLLLAVVSAATVSLVLLSVVLAAPAWCVRILDQPALQPHLWLLPVGVLTACTYSALQFWFVREQRFSLLARTRVAQSTVSAGTQLGIGLWRPVPAGLLIGYVMNSATACLVLVPQLVLQVRSIGSRRPAAVARLRRLFRKHSRYPRFSTLEALCGSAAVSVPVIMIAALAAGPEAGYLTLAVSVMQAPMALVGVSIGQVYLSRATHEHRAGRLGPFTTQTLGGLFKTGAGPLLAAGLVAPLAFGWIFGQPWERAGWLVSWMTPWFVMQFVSSPISMALYITSHQRTLLLLQIFGLGLRVGAVWLSSVLWPAVMVEAYAVSGFVFYCAYLVTILRVTGARPREVAEAAGGALPLTGVWCVAGLGVAAILAYLRP